MADAKVTALTELTAVESTDLLYVIDDPAGTPAGKKATVANVLQGGGVDYGYYRQEDMYLACALQGIDDNGPMQKRATFRPFFVDRACTITQLACKVGTAAAGSTLRLGVYTWNPATPSTLGTRLSDAGTVDSSSTGVKEITSLSVALTRGWHALLMAGSDHDVRVLSCYGPGQGDWERFGYWNLAQNRGLVGWGKAADYSAGLPSPGGDSWGGISGGLYAAGNVYYMLS